MGNLYVASFAPGRICKFTPDGVGSIFAQEGVGALTGLAFDRSGNLYTADWGNSRIVKFTPDGVGSVFADHGLNRPVGLAFDREGNLYAVNAGNNSIEKFTPDGVGSVFANDSTLLAGPGFVAFTDDAGIPLLQPGGRLVPEPSTWALLGLGLPALLGFSRRRHG
jgi:hypothetical protein